MGSRISSTRAYRYISGRCRSEDANSSSIETAQASGCSNHAADPEFLKSLSSAYAIVRSMGYPQDVVDRAANEILDRGEEISFHKLLDLVHVYQRNEDNDNGEQVPSGSSESTVHPEDIDLETALALSTEETSTPVEEIEEPPVEPEPETGQESCANHAADPEFLKSLSSGYAIVRSMGYPQEVVDRAANEILDSGRINVHLIARKCSEEITFHNLLDLVNVYQRTEENDSENQVQSGASQPTVHPEEIDLETALALSTEETSAQIGDIEEIFVEPETDSKAGQTDSDMDRNACKICMETTVEILFRPCMHIVCCETCGEELSTCPVCRCEITDRERVYLP